MEQIELLSNILSAIDSDVKEICHPTTAGSLIFLEKGLSGARLSSLKIDKRPGVYIFKTIGEFSLSQAEFNRVPYASKTNKYLTSNLIKSGMYVYVGKSETSVAKRIEEHVNKCGSTEYSMRLFHRYRAYLKPKLCLDVYYLRQEYSKDYAKFLLSELEQKLFDTLKPFIGSRRNG